MAEEWLDELAPALASAGLELFDVQLGAGVLTVTVDRPGGVDLEALSQASRIVSGVLDRLDPVAGRYTLEVSSPGLERHLRTPEHFARAVGETVSVRLRPGAAESRRVRGHLQSADEAGIVLSGPDVPGGRLVVAYDQVERARTVFEWGPSGGPRPGSSKPGPAAGRGTPARAGREPNSAAQTKRRITTP